MSRRLSLRGETLTELSRDELRDVPAGAATDTCLCTLKLNCITGPFTDICPTRSCAR